MSRFSLLLAITAAGTLLSTQPYSVARTYADETPPFESAREEGIRLPQRGSAPALIAVGDLLKRPDHTFVITHGFGGTREQDRFHRLADEIKACKPDCNVLRLDWSRDATKRILIFPDVWSVARNIERVGHDAALALKRVGVDPERCTLIGESFGNYVNHRLAVNLGGVARIMAFNPATELAGYIPPDLRRSAKQSWTFTTSSTFDTRLEIAHRSFFLETPPAYDPLKQHTFGIEWLRLTLLERDLAWLEMTHHIPDAPEAHFHAVAQAGGRIDVQSRPSRVLPVTIEPTE